MKAVGRVRAFQEIQVQDVRQCGWRLFPHNLIYKSLYECADTAAAGFLSRAYLPQTIRTLPESVPIGMIRLSESTPNSGGRQRLTRGAIITGVNPLSGNAFESIKT